MWIVGYVLRERTLRIRVGQRIQVYDIKTRLAYGGHGVCAEQLYTLKKKKKLKNKIRDRSLLIAVSQ